MTFGLVECSECTAFLILDYSHHEELDAEVECAKCGTTHLRKQLCVVTTADDRDTACELRAQQLAERANSSYGFISASSEPPNPEGSIKSPENSIPDSSETEATDSTDNPATANDGPVPKIHDPLQYSEDQATPRIKRRKQYHEVLKGLFETVEEQEGPVREVEIKLSSPEDAGLTLTAQQAVSNTLTVTGDNTISTVWQELVENKEIQRYFLRAARNAVINRSVEEIPILLNAIGISDTPIIGHDTRVMIRTLNRRPAVAEVRATILLEIIQELGNPPSTIRDILAMAKLFRFATHNNSLTDEEVKVPTVSVKLEYQEFTALDRTQRTNICELLTTLGNAMDLRLVTTQVTRAYLRKKHRKDLPGVSDWKTGHHNARIDEALTEFDVDGTSVALLRTVHQEPDGTLSYAALYETLEISNSRVRQCISSLKEYGLIETFGPPAEKKVKLLDAGTNLFTTLEQQFGSPTTLENSENNTPNSQRQKRSNVVNNSAGGARRPEAAVHSNSNTSQNSTDTTTDTASNYTTEYLSELNRDAIAACGVGSAAVTIVDDAIENVNAKTQFVTVDNDRMQVVISGHATTPVNYTVASAVALAHPKLIHEALTDETLDTVLTDAPPGFLRNAREIGYLTDEVLTDTDRFRELFVGWGKDVEELTKIRSYGYGNGDFDDQHDLEAEICQQAHGLAGSIVHVLDEAGFDVIRDIRVPAKLNSSKLEALAESIAHSMLIQSHYKGFNAFRQLFEKREDYRARSYSVEVDAADPTGTFIGSMVIRGGGATRLPPALISKLQSYELHEDAPEFTIPITIQKPARETVTEAATRVLDEKNIQLTENAVSVLYAVIDSPFDVVHALEQLDSEHESRDITSVDLRYVLQYLDADDVLSGLPRSVGEIMISLFEATEPISQAELAERADKTGTTIRNHEDPLLQSGLARLNEKSSGKKEWRASLSFAHEHGRTVFPDSCSKSLAGLVSDIVGIDRHWCECSGDCVTALREGDLNDLTESCSVSRWGRVYAALTNSEALYDQGQVLNRITVGIEPKQTAIGESALRGDEETSVSEEETNEVKDSSADHSSGDTDDDDSKFDFSDVSIEGSDW